MTSCVTLKRDRLIRIMGRAEYYCAHAISTFSPDYDDEAGLT